MAKNYFNYNNEMPLHLGSLASRQAKFCLTVFKTMEEKSALSKDNLKQQSFLLAVSGGIDSLAMLAIFTACQQYFGYQLHVAHFNHGIRQESADEEKMVKAICHRLNISCTIDRADTPEFARQNKIGLEEAGRILRYDFFAKIQKSQQDPIKNTSCILCTAHHADDLCEDVLMRLIRGTAWPQLAGMDYYDNKRNLLRPLLNVPKNELVDLMQNLGFPHATDTSNADTAFLRNRIRHTLIPLLEKENPQFYKNILKLKKNAEYDKEHFQNETNKILTNCQIQDNTITISLKHLQDKDKTIRLHCYHALLKKLEQGHAITNTFEKLDNAVIKNHGTTEFKFSDNARMRIQNNFLQCFIKDTH